MPRIPNPKRHRQGRLRAHGRTDWPYLMPTTASHYAGWDYSGVNSIITVTGSGISNVTDATGNGRDATQGSDADRPAYGTRKVNSLLVADFNAQDMDLPASIYTNSWATVNPQTWLMVAVFDSFSATNNLMAFSFAAGSTRNGLFVSGGNIQARYPNGVTQATLTHGDTPATNTLYLFEFTHDSAGNVSFNVNEGTAVTAADGGDSGSGTAGSLGGNNLTKAICECHVFNAELSSTELAVWRTYLRRWGTFGAAPG